MEVNAASGVRNFEQFEANREANKELDKDAFLKILVMQLSNQNPLEPTSDTEFIAQLAQFSMLEQIQSLNTTMTTGQNQSLVGKHVYVTQEVEGQDQPELVFGKVNGIIKQDGIDYILVGDEKFEASKVVGIVDSIPQDGNSEILQSSNLIGKAVRAKIYDEEGTASMVTGMVEKITISDGAIFAIVNGEKIEISCIQEIATSIDELSPIEEEPTDEGDSPSEEQPAENP